MVSYAVIYGKSPNPQPCLLRSTLNLKENDMESEHNKAPLNRRAVLATLAAAPAFGMGLAYAQSSSVTGSADRPAELRILAATSFAPQWQSLIVPEFNKKFPNIKVQVDGVPYAEMTAKIMLDLTGASPTYDAYAIDEPWLPQVAETGQLLEVRKETAAWTEANYNWGDFNAAPLAAGQWKDGQFGVPLIANLLLRFYNRTHYAKARLPEPTASQTWAEFLEQAPKLVQDVKGTGSVNAWAIATYFGRAPLTPTIWQGILSSYGGDLVDAQNRPSFNNANGIRALQTHIDLLKWAPPGAKSHGFLESLQAFRQGQAANMIQWGSGYKGSVDPASSTLKAEEVGIITMPVGSSRPGTHRGVWNGSISRKSKNAQTAWIFWQWLSSNEGEKLHLAKLGAFPARRSTIANGPYEPWQGPVLKALQQGYEAAEAGKMWRIRSPKSDQAQSILADETARAFNSEVSAVEALESAARKIERLRL